MLRNPNTSITDGYDIHVVFSQNDEERATTLFEHFVGFIESKSIQYLRAKIFQRPVGPWPLPMWQVILPFQKNIYQDLGLCISWFMLNRDGFSVMIHPNTKEEDGKGGSYEDHVHNLIWLGKPVSLYLEKL